MSSDSCAMSPVATACALVTELSREEPDFDVVHGFIDSASSEHLRTAVAVAAQLVVTVGSDDPEEAVRLVRRVAMREARRRAGVAEEEGEEA